MGPRNLPGSMTPPPTRFEVAPVNPWAFHLPATNEQTPTMANLQPMQPAPRSHLPCRALLQDGAGTPVMVVCQCADATAGLLTGCQRRSRIGPFDSEWSPRVALESCLLHLDLQLVPIQAEATCRQRKAARDPWTDAWEKSRR